MKSKIENIYLIRDENRICQGDILRDYVCQSSTVFEGKAILKDVTFPYVIILSQDCDLEWDFNNRIETGEDHDKFLHSILICPAYFAERLKEGTHLEILKFKMEYIGGRKWNDVKTNQNPRYHFLIHDRELQIPDLAIDFKHYFTVPRDRMYEDVKKHYIASINELFREELSQRFAYYLSRIGVPEIKYREEVNEYRQND